MNDRRLICPCRVCQSDLWNIVPCEQPLMMEVIEPKVYDLIAVERPKGENTPH